MKNEYIDRWFMADPPWCRIVSLEVAPVRVTEVRDGNEICRTCQPEEADFWSVYGRDVSGQAMALADCDSELAANAFLKARQHLCGTFKPSTKYVTYIDTMCDGWVVDDEFDTLSEAEAERRDYARMDFDSIHDDWESSPEDYEREPTLEDFLEGDECHLYICPVEDFIHGRKCMWGEEGGYIAGQPAQRRES